MLQGRTPLATMNRFYSLQLQSRKRSRKNKRTKDILHDDSIEPNYPHRISFDSFDQDIQLISSDYMSYPTNSMDDDQLSVLTEDRNRNIKNLTASFDSDMPFCSEKIRSDLFLTTSGKLISQVKNYPYLYYDPSHPTMLEIFKNHFQSS